MNRKLKFRIWSNEEVGRIDIENGKMVHFKGGWINPFRIEVNENGELFDLHGEQSIIIQQFTGLFDKNGGEIYEGDILKVITSGDWFKYTHNMEVKFEQKKFGESEGIGFFCIPNDREVIGNIFENLELLKK